MTITSYHLLVLSSLSDAMLSPCVVFPSMYFGTGHVASNSFHPCLFISLSIDVYVVFVLPSCRLPCGCQRRNIFQQDLRIGI